MKKYHVFGKVSATITTTFTTEANSPEEAMDEFFDSNQATPSICHQCVREVEVEDVYAAVVMDENGEEVLTDDQEIVYLDTVLKLLKSDKSKEDIIKGLSR